MDCKAHWAEAFYCLIETKDWSSFVNVHVLVYMCVPVGIWPLNLSSFFFDLDSIPVANTKYPHWNRILTWINRGQKHAVCQPEVVSEMHLMKQLAVPSWWRSGQKKPPTPVLAGIWMKFFLLQPEGGGRGNWNIYLHMLEVNKFPVQYIKPGVLERELGVTEGWC